MKKVASLILVSVCLSMCFSFLHAQTSTYILLRHAEKDTSAAGSSAMKADPPLSKEGEARALKLLTELRDYSIDAVYSTNFTRTRSTVAPIAKRFGKEIQLYDPKDLAALSEKLLAQKGKTIIVAGHSNTTPALVNLLIKENKYPALDESVYNLLWIVTVTDGKATAQMLTY